MILGFGASILRQISIARNNADKPGPSTNFGITSTADDQPLIYSGDELNFTDEVLEKVLTKHFPYYNNLSLKEKTLFINRLKTFIALKTFIIYDKTGFREMPILISATAIKFSFGLKKFTLPHYTHIHIFPEEFIGVYPSLRILAGNVSGNRIHISWKHFLAGYQLPEDGQNVGLHEMAHAYYYQNFETGDDVDEDFVSSFDMFNTTGSMVFEKEKHNPDPFYSQYGLTNFQEFWAESVELFFERSDTFKNNYAELYYIMVNILNQDPCRN